MTFPVGGLPNQGHLANLQVPFKSASFTPGGVDMDLTDPANGCVPCARELRATSEGTLLAQLAGDSTYQTYYVMPGAVVLGAFVLIKSTSTAFCFARS
jgi:hypothetical protein